MSKRDEATVITELQLAAVMGRIAFPEVVSVVLLQDQELLFSQKPGSWLCPTGQHT